MSDSENSLTSNPVVLPATNLTLARLTSSIQELRDKRTRAKEKTRALEDIQRALSDSAEEIHRELDRNSVDQYAQNVLSWTALFVEIAAFFEAEASRPKVAANRVQYLFELVRSVAKQANRKIANLDMMTFFEFLRINFNDTKHILTLIFGLLNMLNDFVSVRHYTSCMKSSVWAELLGIVLKLCKNPRWQSHTEMLVEILNKVVVFASDHPTLIPFLRDEVVPFFDCNLKDKRGSHLAEVRPKLIEGAILLCRMNAIEFRKVLCQLGENTLPSLLSSVSVKSLSWDSEKTILLDYINNQLKLHHPCDVGFDSPAFYAHDLVKWNELVQRIYCICYDAIEYIAKRKGAGYHQDAGIPEILLLLAVKVSKQTADNNRMVTEAESIVAEAEGPSSKRQMGCRSFQSIISEVIALPPSESQLIWIQYIGSVIDVFPDMLDATSFQTLMQMGISLLQSGFNMREEIYDYFNCLLRYENFMLKSDTPLERCSTWNLVWDLTVKLIRGKDIKPGVLELLRQLIVFVQPTNISTLLQLYLSGVMPLNKESLQLLSEYLRYCTLPQRMASHSSFYSTPESESTSISSPRTVLIKWLISSNADSFEGNELISASIITALLVKRSHVLMQTLFGSPDLLIIKHSYQILQENFEMSLLESSFVCHETGQTNYVERNATSDDAGAFVLQQEVATFLIDLLHDENLVQSNGKQKEIDCLRKYTVIQSRAVLLLNIFNMLRKHRICNGGDFGIWLDTKVKEIFAMTLSQYKSILPEFVKSNSQNLENMARLTSLAKCLLQSEHLCDEVVVLLEESYPREFLELFRKMFHSSLSKFVNDSTLVMPYATFNDRKDLFTVTADANRMEFTSLEALRCLLLYGLVCSEKCSFFLQILNDLYDEDNHVRHLFHFKLCEELVRYIVRVLQSEKGLQNRIFELLQKMCKTYFANSECVATLWSLFADLTPIVSEVPIEYEEIATERPKRRLMSLVGPLSSYLMDASIKVSDSAFRMLTVLAKNDPAIRWSGYMPKNSQEYEWILLKFSQYLMSTSHNVRMLASKVIHEMFLSSFALTNEFSLDVVKESTEKRKSFYEVFYNTLLKAYDCPDGTTDEALRDERHNRTVLILWSLTKVMFAYLLEQRRVMFSLCMIVELKKIDVSLADRALRFANPRGCKTMIARVSYVLEKWFKMDFPLNSFPVQFFNCRNVNEFDVKFFREIVVQYFELNKIDELNNFSNSLQRSKEELVTECYGIIMGRVAPSLAFLQKNKEGSVIPIPKHISQANEAHKRLISVLGGKNKLEALMVQHLGDVVLNIISLTYNANVTDAWNCPEIRLAEPEPPFYSEDYVLLGLEFLKESSPQQKISIIGYLIQNSPRSLYKILMTLLRRVHDAHDQLEKCWRLHHYSIFIVLLLSEPKEVFADLQVFLCQFIIHSYLRLVAIEKNDRFLKAVLYLFLETSKKLVAKCSDEVSFHYRYIVASLVSVFRKFPALKDKILETLHFFVIVKGEIFSLNITTLDPFPENDASFQEFRNSYYLRKYGSGEAFPTWSLEKELSTCLIDMDITKNNVTREKLQYLKTILATRKSELKGLVQELQEKRFLEECKNNYLHNVLRLLVGIVNHSKDNEIVLEACRCLGEIGPIDLSVLVLPTFGRHSKISTIALAIPSIIESAASYLISEDLETAVIAGEVLNTLMEMKECSDILKSESEKAEQNKRLLLTLTPFMSQKPITKSVEKVDIALLEKKLELLAGNEYIEYSSWILQLTCALIDTIKPEGLLARIVPLCKRQIEFCEDTLPVVIFYALFIGKHSPAVRKLVSSFFQQFLNHFLAHKQNNLHPTSRSAVAVKTQNSIYINKLALRCIIRVVQFLRDHTAPREFKDNQRSPPTPWDNNFWLDLSYLDLAKAAQYCGAQLTAILFAEIFASCCTAAPAPNVTEMDDFYSQDTTCYPTSKNQAEQIEKILLTAFSNIGEQDAIFGCGYSRLYDFQSNLQYLQQMKKWDRSLFMYDSGPSSHQGVCLSMKELGLYETLWTYLQGIGQSVESDSELAEIQFECGWRLAKWDLNINKASFVKDMRVCNDGFRLDKSRQKFLFESIQNGLSEDSLSYSESLKSGFKSVAEALKNASLESSVNLYGFLSFFQCFSLVEDYFNCLRSESSINELAEQWKLQDAVGFVDFKFQDSVLCLRSVLLNSFRQTFPARSAEADVLYDESLHQLVTLARAAGRLELAEKFASKLIDSVNKTRKQVEVARNYSARGDKDVACHILKRIIAKTNPDDCKPYFASLLLLYGEWLFETMAERPILILDKCLFRACQYYESSIRPGQELEDVAKANFTLAKYADTQYQSICNYVKSDLFTEKAQQLQKAKEEQSIAQDALKNEKVNNADIKKTEAVLRKQSHIDQTEMQTTYLEKKKFLLLSLRHYLRGLNYSNSHDLLIFRAIGLWLERADMPQDEVAKEANSLICEANLPSHKYIIVLNQLSARMGVANSSINQTINNILVRCSMEHPYHALPCLLTQACLNKDKEALGIKRPSESNVQTRVQAACKIIVGLKKQESMLALIKKMESLWMALIQLANVQDARNVENVKRNIPEKAVLRSLTVLEDVPVPITVIPISCSNTNTPEIIGIHKFNSTYQLVGGINSPKRISCVGTNGRTYNMLLKGLDDLRQDALMQQVFGVMNKLLQVEPRTKLRRLQVRTYKVVPLSQRSGVIEWCENTQTFGEYLIGQSKDAGAHALYRPEDIKPSGCRKKLNEVKDCGDNQKKLLAFKEVLEQFKPVFRHFFFEHFKDAGSYFERRLAYTRSVATSSMVGYILGLGDRHVLNILVDKTTAEFIHIDLGVAFEQGRILPTPELIPFRLTRDVVDGMGVAGIEGVFRRSSEMTLDVLRKNSEIILTILEVLLYDPLYIWTLTSDRMRKVQPTESNKAPVKNTKAQLTAEFDVTTTPKQRNNSAARVLLRLRQKLLGIEEAGTSGSSLSVPGHVSLLIQKAVDPDFLSRIFPGWQPYL